MDFLIFSQTVFYLVSSITVILIGVLVCIATLHLIAIAKHLHRLSSNLEGTSKEVEKTVGHIIDVLAELPVMSFLFKKAHHVSKYHKK